MNPNSDTLNIRPLQLDGDLPMAEVQRAGEANERNPDAASRARMRIAELTEAHTDPIIEGMLPPLITDKALLAENLQAKKTRSLPRRPAVPSRLQPVLVAVGIFALTLLAFKAPVIYEQLRYHNNNNAAVTIPASTPALAPVTAAPTITISKINVNAPVVYLTSTDETAVLQGLENGVVHYGNTPNPGQGGNAVFFGHSSNDWWEPGNYKFVFVLLDKLIVGDTFSINYNSVRYTYQVTGTQVVDPTDVAVLDQTSTPTATLITCSPPGTSWKRLVVSAKQISPAPSGTTAPATTATKPDATTLPSNAPGLFSQVGQAVSGAWHTLFGGGAAKTTTTSTPAAGTPTELPAAN
jgi:LPXTG-site transpeptidase (sortase) family protein